MSLHAGLLDVTPSLQPERDALLTLLAGLSPSDWELPTECPEWTVKGIALHILGDDLSLLSRQRDESTDSLTIFATTHPGLTFRELLDGFNNEWVRSAEFLSHDLVLEQLRQVGDSSDRFYTAVGLDTIAREPVGFFAADGPSPYWQVIGREFVERVIHQSQIRRAVGAPDCDLALVTEAARVQVHALAEWLRNDAPADGSTIGIIFGDVGSWTLRRESGGWSVTNGGEGPTDAGISVASEVAVAALTRGMTAAELLDVATVDGDSDLAGSALAVLGPFLGRPEN